MPPISPRDRLAKLAVQRAFEATRDKKNVPSGSEPWHLPMGGTVEGVPDEKPKVALPRLPRLAVEKLPIGIIGAGSAGLCAAMMLQDLEIGYEIVEAMPDEDHGGRVGGHIYTYRFNGKEGLNAPINDPKRYDYIDMGGMRFPDILSHAPTFRLFKRLFPGDLYKKMVIDYKMTSTGQIDYYNGVACLSSAVNNVPDVFNVKAADSNSPGDPTGGFVPAAFLSYQDQQGVTHYVNDGGFWTDAAIGRFVSALSNATTPEAFETAWNDLIRYDSFSTRSFMATDSDYPQAVIEWLEMMNTGTGLYNHALVESVLDAMDFGDPSASTSGGLKATKATALAAKSNEDESSGWYCIDGGSDRFIRAMVDQLQKKPEHGKRVTAVRPSSDNTCMEVQVAGEAEPRRYSQVICTVPLGCLASIDMDDCGLTFTQKVAIRSLAYDASTKVALRFEKRWWETLETPIIGGVTNTDLPVRVVVYPSYGLDCPKDTPPPGVMIGSYTWAQDARRMGSIAETEGTIVDLVLNNVAKIHGIPQDKMDEVMGPRSSIKSKFVAWYNEPNARGAFALFGPGQFGSTDQKGFSLFASLKSPAAKGRLHLAGEATSIHHAWVVGALNSAWRAVYNALWDEDLRSQLVAKWPVPDEEDTDILPQLAIYGSLGQI